MKRTLIACLIVLVALPVVAGAQSKQAVRRVLVSVGANDGGEGRPVLRYAHTDAKAVSRVLGELGGVAEDGRVLVIGATRAALLKAISEAGDRAARLQGAARRVEVIFYYSGHSDEDGLLLKGKRLEYRDLRRAIDTIGADVRIVILDSCASGALTRRKGGVRRPPFLLDTSTSVTGHAYLTSSSEDEVAQESDRIEGSFFTHFLVSGLRGAADMTRDGRITLHEAYRYAYDETLRRTERTRSGPQHAAYDIQLAGTGDLVLTEVRSDAARLHVASEVHGRLFVRSAGGRLAAELDKKRGRPMVLGLAQGRYVVTAELSDGLFGAQVNLREGRRTRVRRADLKRVAVEQTVARGSHPPARPEVVVEEETLTIEPVPRGADIGKTVPVNVSLLPYLSINHGREDVTNHFALNVLAGYGDRLRGFEAGIGANIRGSRVVGVQTAIGANVTRGYVTGLQMAMGYNQSELLEGGQLSLGANVATHYAKGAQVAGVFNYAESGNGLQAAAVNISTEHYSGAQIGLINIGGDVRGLQLGLVNYADQSSVPIGLLNIIRKGLHHVSLTTSDLNALNLGLRLGGRYFYTLVTAGMQPQFRPVQWSMGLGMGGHIPISERTFIAIDLAAHKLTAQKFNDLHMLTRVRALVGFRIMPRFAVVAGLSGNVLAEFDGHRLDAQAYGIQAELHRDSDLRVTAWPGFVGGLEF